MATKTQRAKRLYTVLRKFELVDLFFEGLMGDAVWISSHAKAYRIKDLGDNHLSNIITKYRKRGEEVPLVLLNEYNNRRGNY